MEEKIGSVQVKRVLRGAKQGLLFVKDNQGIQQAAGRVLFVVEDNQVIQQAVSRGLFVVEDNQLVAPKV